MSHWRDISFSSNRANCIRTAHSFYNSVHNKRTTSISKHVRLVYPRKTALFYLMYHSFNCEKFRTCMILFLNIVNEMFINVTQRTIAHQTYWGYLSRWSRINLWPKWWAPNKFSWGYKFMYDVSLWRIFNMICKSITGHTAYSIVSSHYPKQWLMAHTCGLMVIIR